MLIILVSAVSMVGCKKTTAEIYVESMAKIAALDALETKMNLEMTMSIPNVDEEVKLEMDILSKTGKMKSDSPIAYAEVEVDMIGQSSKATTYLENDYLYISSMGQKMKLSLEQAETLGYKPVDTEGYSIDIPEDMLANTEFTTDEDGNYILSFEFEGKEYAELMNGITDSIMENLGEVTDEYEITLGRVYYDLLISEDCVIKSMDLKMNMDITFQGETMTMSVVAHADYVAFDDDVVITPPAGY